MFLLSAISVAGLGLFGAYYAPCAIRWLSLPMLRRQATRARSLVLTYDDGPTLTTTPRLLDLLHELCVPATFFPLGVQAKTHPEILDRAKAEGHEIGWHGHAHVNALRNLPWRVASDVLRGHRVLEHWISGPQLYRPPFGRISLPSFLVARYCRATVAWWTMDSGDTHTVLPQCQAAVDALAREGGGVVLMHDLFKSKERIAYVLRTTESLVDMARREGLTICRYSDLWRSPAID